LLTVQNYRLEITRERVVLPVLQKQVELPVLANILYYDFYQHF